MLKNSADPPQYMKALVTGASGFVGKAIVAELLSRGIDVVAAGGPNTAFEPGTIQSGNYYSIDITDSADLDKILEIEGADCVIHSAGLAHRFGNVATADYQSVNVTGVENVANLAVRLGAKHFILVSSVLVYGKNSTIGPAGITEDFECRPTDPYSQSKLDGEIAAKLICEVKSMALTILRPAPIIGEGSKGNFARLIRAIDKGRFVSVGKGLNHKSFVYVGDVARACAVILENKTGKNEIFNVTAKPVQMRDVVSEIYRAINKKPIPFSISPDLLRNTVQLVSNIALKNKLAAILKSLDTWVSEDVYSAELLHKSYGFVPQVTIKEAILLEVAWYLKSK